MVLTKSCDLLEHKNGGGIEYTLKGEILPDGTSPVPDKRMHLRKRVPLTVANDIYQIFCCL